VVTLTDNNDLVMFCPGNSTAIDNMDVGDLMIINSTDINSTTSASNNANIRTSNSTVGSAIYESTRMSTMMFRC
jgi:hypothetical protein